MDKKQREIDKHAAGAQGKSARKGHVEPDKSGNQPSQREPGRFGLPGEGRGHDPQRSEAGKAEK
jgi:hypothetical protein